MQPSSQQNRIQPSAREVLESTNEFVSQNATPTALAVFGIGLGLGIALGSAIGGASSRGRDENVAHRLGKRMLEVISNAVPDSLPKIGS